MNWRPLPDPDATGPPVKLSLERLVKKLGLPSTANLQLVFDRWPEAVGARISEHSRPISLRNGVLRVVVDDSQWLTQLKWVAPNVIERLNGTDGKTVVEKLEFRLE